MGTSFTVILMQKWFYITFPGVGNLSKGVFPLYLFEVGSWPIQHFTSTLVVTLHVLYIQLITWAWSYANDRSAVICRSAKLLCMWLHCVLYVQLIAGAWSYANDRSAVICQNANTEQAWILCDVTAKVLVECCIH